MKLFFVHRQDDDNFDLFVWAKSARSAANQWRKHFAETTDILLRTWELPTSSKPDKTQVMKWEGLRCVFNIRS